MRHRRRPVHLPLTPRFGVLHESDPGGARVHVLPRDDRGCDLVEPSLAVYFAVEVLGVLLTGVVPVASAPPPIWALGDAGHVISICS